MSRDEEILSARRKSVRRSKVVGNVLNSTGFVMYIETISTMTDNMMSAEIRKSSRNAGSGVIIAITIARTPTGTAISPIVSRVIAPGTFAATATLFDISIFLPSHCSPAAHQTINVGEYFGNCPIELGWNLLADFRRGVKPACEGRIFDNWHTAFDCLLPNPQSQVVFPLRYY